MKNRVFIVCLISVLTISLMGCGSNDTENDDYASYSQSTEDTTITEISQTDTSTVTTIDTTDDTSESSETISDTTTTSDDTTSDSTSNVTTTIADTTTKTTTVTTKSTTVATTIATTVTTTQSTTENTEPQNNQVPEQPADNPEPDNPPVEDTTIQEEPSNTPCFEPNDMYLSASNGYSFTVDMNIDEVIANLGDNYTLESAPSCYYDGEDRIYIYDDFSIYTYTLDGTSYYSQEIEITSDSLSTNKGIKIGSSLADIESAYGTDYQVFGNEYRFYSNDNTYLYFFMFDGVVDSLGYRIEIEV